MSFFFNHCAGNGCWVISARSLAPTRRRKVIFEFILSGLGSPPNALARAWFSADLPHFKSAGTVQLKEIYDLPYPGDNFRWLTASARSQPVFEAFAHPAHGFPGRQGKTPNSIANSLAAAIKANRDATRATWPPTSDGPCVVRNAILNPSILVLTCTGSIETSLARYSRAATP